MARHYFIKAFSSKLSRQLTLCVFGSLMAIEAIILVPSYFKRERDLLAAQEALVSTSLETAFDAETTEQSPVVIQANVLTLLSQLKSQKVVLDYAVTTEEGMSLTHQSRALNVDLQTTQNLLEQPVLRRIQQTYDSAIYLDSVLPPLYIFLRYDTQATQSELNAYTGRMLGMILLISLVVTVTTMIGVERLVLRPVLYLQGDLLSAIDDLQSFSRQNAFRSKALKCEDELGDVIDTFGFLYEKIWQAFTAQENAIRAEQQERERANQLHDSITLLHHEQTQLVQSEKMLGLSQLVAGVAHEINNPITFIHGNLSHLTTYTEDLLSLVELYGHHYPEPVDKIANEIAEIDFDFIREDLPKLLASIHAGSERVRDIVLSLRNFSRLDESDVKSVDIHEGLENTLSMLSHQLVIKDTEEETKEDDREDAQTKAPVCRRINIVRDYSSLPLVECYAGLLNQAFMNILVNAIDSFKSAGALDNDKRDPGDECARITVRTGLAGDGWVEVAIANNGPPISSNVQKRMLEPFFTTKPVGEAKGMGLAIAYQIVAVKHKGKLSCFSEAGTDTEFIIQIPIAALA